jgi:hypothetical protein
MAPLKVRDLQLRIKIFADILSMRNSDKADVRVLRDISNMFNGSENKSLTTFFKTVSSVSVSDAAGGRVVMGTALAPLKGLRDLLAGVAPKDLIGGLDSLLALLDVNRNVTPAAFVASLKNSAAVTSRTKTKKAALTMDVSIVAEYARQLEAALGDDSRFRSVFEQLRSDPNVGQLEAVEIANRFVGYTPPRTARTKALSGIRDRHKKLMDFKGKPSSAGRSAA